MNLYIGWHGYVLLSHIVPPQYETAPAYWPIFAIVAFAYLLGRVRFLSRSVRLCLTWLGAYYIAVFEWSLVLLLVADVAACLLYLAGVETTASVPALGLAVCALLLALLLRGSWNAWTPVVRTYRIAVDKPAGGLQQLRLAVASDLHLGHIVGNSHLRRLVREMNRLEPDLILLPGDVLDHDIEPFVRKRMTDELRRLRATHGTFAALGNHEYYGGHIEQYVGLMKEIGIRVLRDEAADAADGAVTVVGRKDKAAESMDPASRRPIAELLADVDRSRPVIVMDHQPHQLDKAEAAGADVLLSGHTHRGQFAPNHWITRRMFELDWGYLRKGRMHAIVSSGFGTWGPPVRIASRSELLHIIITFRSNEAGVK
ncbi:metallophosphoesterase [Gordoniibacillus kamchatkensis]|uniref:metallophosphoesterase n=1 Tax=Gordoniibacillus kamchatkensis TaxID=1590651 RepID=UPI002F3EB673